MRRKKKWTCPVMWQEMPLKHSRPLRPEVVALWQEAGGWARRASRPGGCVGTDLCSVRAAEFHDSWLSRGEGLGRASGSLGFHCKKEKRNELVLLCCRFSGSILWLRWTSSRLRYQSLPSVILSAPNTGHIWMEPNKVGVGVIWGWAMEYLRIVGKPQEAFLGTQGLGSSSGIPHPEGFANCFKSKHWSVSRRCSFLIQSGPGFYTRARFLSQRAGQRASRDAKLWLRWSR